MFSTVAWAVAFVFIAQQERGAPGPLEQIRWEAPHGSYAAVRLTIREHGDLPPAAALSVVLDGVVDHVLVVTPGVGRTRYATLVGPLRGGTHAIELKPSPLWPGSEAITVAGGEIDVIASPDPRAAVMAYAPAIGLRADTIGSASDLPLLMYVEDARSNGDGWLRYSMIFSHEDGGTPGVALMARWGRTTDIELIYEVELRGGRVVQARYQGPDHHMLAPASPDARSPRLNVVTLNNMVIDRGTAATYVRPVPEPVDLTDRSRETVMDERPWTYRVMAHELARERPAGVSDPRDYLYVDLRVARADAAAVVLGARDDRGTTRWSDRGRSDFKVARIGEVRIAVPLPASAGLDALTIRCDSRPDTGAAPGSGTCDVSIRQMVRLTAEYRPEPVQVEPRRLTLVSGTSDEVRSKIKP
jgi:hypothetical protein